MGKFRISHGLCLILAVSLVTPGAPVAFAGSTLDVPVANINAGDTASAVPEVKLICKSLNAALDGSFATAGSFTTIKPECESLPRRERNGPNCQVDRGPEIAKLSDEAKQKKIDELCAAAGGTASGVAGTNCALRNVAKGGQAKQYCDAYESAEKAQKGVIITTALDVAAAGACWSEALSMRTLLKAYNGWSKLSEEKKLENPFNYAGINMTVGSIFNKGICGGAAMAAGVGELVQTSRVLFGGSHSAGDLKIDSDNNVSKRKNLGKLIEVVGSAGLSLTAIQLGVCYYKIGNSAAYGEKGFCRNFDNAELLGKEKASVTGLNLRKKIAGSAQQSLELNSGLEAVGTDGKKLDRTAQIARSKKLSDTANANVNDAYAALVARANLAQQSAILFTGLTAMRAVSLVSSGSTMKKAKTILQSMFVPGGNGSSFGATGYLGAGNNVFISNGSSTFSQTKDGTQPVTASAIAADSPESFLLPPGSPQATLAESIARQIPENKVVEAAAMGAAGMGALVSSVAGGLGAKDTSGIRAAMASSFANLPKDSGEFSSGSGGKLATKGGSGSGDLNLKSLFGAGEKEDQASAAPDLAYRGLASDDIWHSQNPRGNNLFQIVSERYDNTQRKQSLSP